MSKKVSISGIGNGRKKSVVWGHFENIKVKEVTKAICNCCPKSYHVDNKSCVTSNLLAHLLNCPKNPNREDLVKGQKTLAFEPKRMDDKGSNLCQQPLLLRLLERLLPK